MKKCVSKSFQSWKGDITNLTNWFVLIFLINFNFILTRITIEFRVRIFIKIDNTITFLMKTLIALIAIYDFVFFTNIGRETYFAVGFEDVGELGFGLHEIFYSGFKESLFVTHVFCFVLLYPHALQCLC